MEQPEFTPQQYRKFNGQSIMLALEAMGGSASADDLATHIGASIDQPQHIVKSEVTQVLRRGISSGFFQRRGKQYFLFNNESITYQVDGKKRKRKAHTALQLETDGKRIRLESDSDDDDDSDIQSAQTIEGLRNIIAKANEKTQRATVLATKAAERAKLASMKIQEIVENEQN